MNQEKRAAGRKEVVMASGNLDDFDRAASDYLFKENPGGSKEESEVRGKYGRHICYEILFAAYGRIHRPDKQYLGIT